MAQPATTSVTANFPFPVLSPFASETTQPNHATLQVLQRELNANAMSVHSNDGGGLHGHLTLTVTAAKYLTVAGVAFPAPVAPPANAVIPVGATAAIIGDTVRQHQEDCRFFQRYHDTDKALVRAIIAATPITYIEALSDVDFGFATVTTLQMMIHLTNTYGSMTSADREANLTRMNAPWSPPTPIETLFQQLESGQRYALLAAEPIADTQLTRIGLSLITKTGMFSDGCREWRLQPVANQTWAAFKSHFSLQDRDRIENATASTAGYAMAALAIQPIVPTVDGTALATATLPSGPELVAMIAELHKLRAAAAQLAASAQQSHVPRAARPPQPAAAAPTARGYCWTHGSTANGTHTSATCLNKAPGHVDTATWRNKQGGNPASYVPLSRRAPTPGP
jgi:hypothetical protein